MNFTSFIKIPLIICVKVRNYPWNDKVEWHRTAKHHFKYQIPPSAQAPGRMEAIPLQLMT